MTLRCFRADRFFLSLFFSSGYDHVLLLSYLVPQLYELGYGPRVERRGNKISQISVSRGGGAISFRDITKLLAPSTSLRKFGELFGLEQTKAHFPFALLRSVEVLSRPGLPSDPAEWTSDLTGSAITEAEIAEALALFEEAGCESLGDYLAAYLRLDVEILYRATQEWRKTLARVVGVDFVESRKFTISSLSYTAGLKSWEARGRIGSFFPNNSQIYRLLRRGMRG